MVTEQECFTVFQRVEYLLQNLPAFSEIAVQIRVLNKYYVGPPSTPIYFRTQAAGQYVGPAHAHCQGHGTCQHRLVFLLPLIRLPI